MRWHIQFISFQNTNPEETVAFYITKLWRFTGRKGEKFRTIPKIQRFSLSQTYLKVERNYQVWFSIIFFKITLILMKLPPINFIGRLLLAYWFLHLLDILLFIYKYLLVMLRVFYHNCKLVSAKEITCFFASSISRLRFEKILSIC